jgi:glycosyltransferase involved in cell wall biosynthesis
MVGTLSAMKGAWDFISAAGLVRRREPTRKFRFIIVAPIPDREPRQLGLWERFRPGQARHPEDQAWHLARGAGIAGQLILTGYRQDVLALISAMEMVVVCTRLGVIGRPPFEAMAIGRPVIVTAGHSGRTGVVRDNETALVVPPADVEALSEAIIKLSCDPKLRQQMGESGAEYARMHFAPQKNIHAVQHVYEELLKEQAQHVA